MKDYVKKILRPPKKFMDETFGTAINEFFWRVRGKKWAKNYLSEESLSHPHRRFLIEKIKSHLPFESVLEVGCASGPNLYLLAKEMPEVKLYGTDINKGAIVMARKWFAERNIAPVLSARKAEDLSSFMDKSIDIVFTDAALVCVGPDKIEKVIKELIRVAKKTLILNEWHSETSAPIYRDHWAHNYGKLFVKFAPKDNVRFTKIPTELWGGNWAKYGYLIEVKLG